MTNLSGAIDMPSAANETVRPNSFLRLNEEFLPLPLRQRGESLKEMLERISETERNETILENIHLFLSQQG